MEHGQSAAWSRMSAARGTASTQSWRSKGFQLDCSTESRHVHSLWGCGVRRCADEAQKSLGHGRVWHNLLIPEKTKVAETLAEFRAQFKYNLLDEHLRAFNAKIPTTYLWDDHETKNNWWPGRVLKDRRYSEKRCDLLAARARHSFLEYCPIAHNPSQPGRIYRQLTQGSLLDVFTLDTRSHRGPNSRNRQEQPGPSTHFLGSAQAHWLCTALRRSTALWKVIACPSPSDFKLLMVERTMMACPILTGTTARSRRVAQIFGFIKSTPLRMWFGSPPTSTTLPPITIAKTHSF